MTTDEANFEIEETGALLYSQLCKKYTGEGEFDFFMILNILCYCLATHRATWLQEVGEDGFTDVVTLLLERNRASKNPQDLKP